MSFRGLNRSIWPAWQFTFCLDSIGRIHDNNLIFPQAFFMSFIILILSTIISSPIFFLTKLEVQQVQGGKDVSFCFEVSDSF